MMGISRRLLAIVLASLTVTAPAIAQPPSPTPSEIQARELTRRAIAKSRDGDHQVAIDLYLEAYKLVPNAMLLSNIGAEYTQIDGRQAEAKKYFCMYIKDDPNGANVGYALGQAKLLARAMGQKDVDDKTVCSPKADKAPPPPPPPPDPVTDNPPPDEVPPPVETPPDPGRQLKLAGVVGLGAGGVGLIAGIIFGVKAQTLSDEITNHPIADEWPNNIEEIEKNGARYERMQVGFLVGGGALVVTGAILFVLGRSKTSAGTESTTQTTVVTPTAGQNGFGFAISGGF